MTGPHRPLFLVAIAFIAGIVPGRMSAWPWEAAVAAMVMCGAGLAVVSVRFLLTGRCRPDGLYSSRSVGADCAWWVVLCTLVFVFLGGFLWIRSADTLPPAHISRVVRGWPGQRGHVVEGTVASEPVTRSRSVLARTTFALDVARVCRNTDCRRASGRTLVAMFSSSSPALGDRVRLIGTVHAPPAFGQGQYRDYLARQGILTVVSVRRKDPVLILRSASGVDPAVILAGLRRRLQSVYERYLSRDEAGLMNAFMLGERAGIPRWINDQFKRTGTAHVVAISGTNITLLSFVFLLLLGLAGLPRRLRYVAAIVLTAGYAMMVGGDPPVTRAALMAAVFLGAFIIERNQDVLNTLGGAALVMAVAAPGQVFDTGFQLSFGCILGIMLFVPEFMDWVAGQGQTQRFRAGIWLGEALAVSVGAWAGSAGIIAYIFGNFTPIAIVANLPVVPLATAVMVLGCGLLITAYVCAPLAVCFALVLKLALNLMVACVFLFSKIPGGYWQVADVPLAAVAGYYILLLAGAGLIRKYRLWYEQDLAKRKNRL